MSDVNVVSAATLERWRRQAKALKKQNRVPHYEALDTVARLTGVFRDWHQLTEAAKATEATERAFKMGLVIGMDIKDADNVPAAKLTDFREDERIASFVLADYKRLQAEDWNEEEARDLFVTEVVYYRWQGALPETLDEALGLARKAFFFAPRYLRLKGKRLWDFLSDEDEDV